MKNNIEINHQPYIISYITLRKAVCILGLTLSGILVVVSLVLEGEPQILNSNST